MGFRAKRGRPPVERPVVDAGTPELRQKRRFGLTEEPVDRLLVLGHIDEFQHKAARRLAWLYRLRHGTPWVRALVLDEVGGRALSGEDEEWNAAREADWKGALECMGDEAGGEALRVTLAVCVDQRVPLLLRCSGAVRARHEVACLRVALDCLVRYWRQPMVV